MITTKEDIRELGQTTKRGSHKAAMEDTQTASMLVLGAKD